MSDDSYRSFKEKFRICIKLINNENLQTVG